MKFAHLGDCHLGGWRFPELQELSMQSFSKALEISMKEHVDLVLISGDLFDSPYPPIETLKQTFKEFKKLHDSKIPCFIIAGSHDYSVSGKTFLDVLEHAGFCKNVFQSDEKNGKIILQPVIHGNYAIYGFPGKKSGLEVQDLKNLEIQDAPGFFKILMLHTALTEALGNLPIDSISISELPKTDYYALGHLHIDFNKENLAYSGPTFPNNFDELEELKHGQFYLVEVKDSIKKEKISLKLKEVLVLNLEITNALTGTDKIMNELRNKNLEDKIILLKLYGDIIEGKPSDINFQEIEKFVHSQKAYSFIKSSSRLISEDSSFSEIPDMYFVEENIIEKYLVSDNSKFKDLIHPLLKSLAEEKQEDETNQVFSDRILSELQKILNF